jgi:hypothetical protein
MSSEPSPRLDDVGEVVTLEDHGDLDVVLSP